MGHNYEDQTNRANGDSSHVIRVFDDEAQAIQSARNSSRMFHEATGVGEAILAKYAGQREYIKRAQRKALDVLNTVGLSNSVLKLIERRHRQVCRHDFDSRSFGGGRSDLCLRRCCCGTCSSWVWKRRGYNFLVYFGLRSAGTRLQG